MATIDVVWRAKLLPGPMEERSAPSAIEIFRFEIEASELVALDDEIREAIEA